MSTTEAPIYQIKVTLNGSKPPIWRRILVPGDVTLAQLHRILQVVMGWYDCHLHQFIVGQVYYGVPDPDYDGFLEMRDESRVTLSQIAPREKLRFRYEYDFGDSWEHLLVVEKIRPPAPDQRYPVCLAGQRACPPEDVGGIWGYYEFLAALQDPQHPEHDSYREWIGGEFDPEAFDLDAVNAALGALRWGRGGAVAPAADQPHLGKLPPQYNFILNPYSEYRFTRCPGCEGKMRQRKVPLLIHVAPMHLIALNYTCRYCPDCDLLLAHQDEVESLLAYLFAERDPSVIGNDYLVIGTLERQAWREGMKQPRSAAEMLEHAHDFKEVRTVEVKPGGWYPAEEV